MIWFACKKCGKRHKQPDDAAGSLIFCECGQANRVPWDSTVLAGRGEDAPRRRSGSDEDEDEREPRRRRRRLPRRPDPAYCLNHEEAATADTCADCGEGFCPRCLIEFEGVRLCGPCKNYRVRKLQRPPRVSGLAIAGLVGGLLSGPVILFVTFFGIGSGQPGVILACGVIGMALGTGALMLGLVGLRDAERKAAGGGQGLALTGAALGTAGLVWSLSLVVVMANRLG